MTKIAFIGGGNMARALIGGLLNSGTSSEQLLVAEPQAEAAASLRRDFGVVVDSNNNEIVAQADCLVLAVKPQVLKQVAQQMATSVQAKKPLVVSIVAGIPMDSLDQWLDGGVSVVRTMPNMPALVGLGITALFANQRASEQQRQLAEQILSAAGSTLWVENEVLLDAVTAVSGSGPAYFFRVMEAMVESGKALGLSAEQATELTLATAAGAAELARQSDHSVATLRQQVTSPGGTTAAALEVMNDQGIGQIFNDALQAACDRAAELAAEA